MNKAEQGTDYIPHLSFDLDFDRDRRRLTLTCGCGDFQASRQPRDSGFFWAYREHIREAHPQHDPNGISLAPDDLPAIFEAVYDEFADAEKRLEKQISEAESLSRWVLGISVATSAVSLTVSGIVIAVLLSID